MNKIHDWEDRMALGERDRQRGHPELLIGGLLVGCLLAACSSAKPGNPAGGPGVGGTSSVAGTSGSSGAAGTSSAAGASAATGSGGTSVSPTSGAGQTGAAGTETARDAGVDSGAPSTPDAGGGAGHAGDAPAASGVLTIYWIDVEGGASTLMVAPTGQVVLVDTGFPGARDAGRIATVLRDEVHATKIDTLIITHYHTDHIGGVPTLAGMFPITRVFDHGATVEPMGGDYNNYVTAVGAKRTTGKPGDKLQVGSLELTFVTAAREVIDPPLPPGTANPLCAAATVKTATAGEENTMSLGFLARFGKFDFVDLGDLTWMIEQKLMCPTNRLGTADIFQVNHHGQDISNSALLVHALAPTVAIMDNGPAKGGAPLSFDTIKASPGLKDLWSLHRVPANDAAHNADDALTANLTSSPDAANWISAVVQSDGSYTVTNSRTGMSRSYMSR